MQTGNKNLDKVLDAMGYKFCPHLIPSDLDPNFSQEDGNKYEKWVKANDIAKCYILTSITNIFITLARVVSDIMFNLRKMSRSQGRLRGRRPCDSILSSRISEGSPVQGNLFRMFLLSLIPGNPRE